jgi:cytochrome c553
MKKTAIFLTVLLFAKDFGFCTSCHNGRKQVDLHKLKKEEIVNRLKYFKKSSKGTMHFIVKNLSEKDIMDIAKTYGK